MGLTMGLTSLYKLIAIGLTLLMALTMALPHRNRWFTLW